MRYLIFLVTLIIWLVNFPILLGDDILSQPIKFYTELRLNFAKQEGYEPNWHISSQRSSIVELVKNDQYEDAAKEVKKWLANYPVDAEMHYYAAHIFAKLGKLELEAKHMLHYNGLLSSLFNSGNGLSKKSAIQVISVAEEYFIIRFLGGTSSKQSLLTEDGCAYDVLEVKFKGKDEIVKMFFDVAIPLVGGESVLC